MPCNQKILQAIENDCTPVKGVAPIAKWAFRSDIAFTFVDNTITAIATPILPLGLFKSFKFGLNAGHEVKVFENYPDRFTHKFMGVSSEATDALDAVDDIVVFVQPKGGTSWKVYGAKNGLWKTSQSFMTNDNMGTVAFEFGSREGLEEIYECYNTSIDISALVDMDSFDLIYGASAVSGAAINVDVPTDKKAYVKFPNGSALLSTSGSISSTNTSYSGKIYFYIEKSSPTASVYETVLTGELNTNNPYSNFYCSGIAGLTGISLKNCFGISAASCPLLTNVIAEKVITLDAHNCALTAQSIGDILYLAYIDNREDVVFDFSGGTNAAEGDVNIYIDSKYGVEVSTYIDALVALGGSITLNS